jgi:hypothetical protein
MMDALILQFATYDPMTACVEQAVNQGIDSRLEGFFNSTFRWRIHCLSKNTYSTEEHKAGLPFGETAITAKLHCHLDPEEVPLLLRRLSEQESEGADELIDWFLEEHYGIEDFNVIFDEHGNVNEAELFKKLLPIKHTSLTFAMWNMSWIAHNIWFVAHHGTGDKDTLVEYAKEFKRNYYAQKKYDLKIKKERRL